jgi:hypothetical protein
MVKSNPYILIEAEDGSDDESQYESENELDEGAMDELKEDAEEDIDEEGGVSGSEHAVQVGTLFKSSTVLYSI